MKRSDPYDFVESKKFEIGSVEKYFRASQRCEILEKSGNSLDFRHRFPRFWTKSCPGDLKNIKTQIVGLIMPIDILVLLYWFLNTQYSLSFFLFLRESFYFQKNICVVGKIFFTLSTSPIGNFFLLI